MLKGKGVLVTRPGASGIALAEAINAAGGRAVCYPTLEILPLPCDAIAADIAIFTSQYSAQHAPIFLNAPYGIAIGPSTAEACRLAGCAIDFFAPAGATSETLLEAAPLQSVEGVRIVIITGAGGRTMLYDVLRQRGAEVSLLSVYLRVPIQQVAPLPEWDLTVVLCTSMDAFESLRHSIADPAWLAQRWILTISPRLEALLRAQGYSKILLAESAQTAAIIACLRAALENSID